MAGIDYSEHGAAATVTRVHIREAIEYAMWEKREIGTKSDYWYKRACEVSRQWRDRVRVTSVHVLAREHLYYWRHRAFIGCRDNRFGYPWDMPAHDKWLAYGAALASLST